MLHTPSLLVGLVVGKVEKALKDIARKMGNGTVNVGFLEGATYPDGTPVATVAFWNEYGTTTAPARPFFRSMISKEKPTWPDKVGSLAKTFNNDGAKILALMGEDIDGALKQSITELTAPALSPTTLVLRERFGNRPEKITYADVAQARKDAANGAVGATGTQAKPLVWTGHMLNSTGYEVKG